MEALPGELTGTKQQGAFGRSMKCELRHQSPGRSLRGARGLTHTVLEDLVTTLFPGDCRLCTAPLLGLSPLPVCETCLSALQPQAETNPGSLCTVCGEALGFESERFLAGRPDPICTPCRRVPPAFTRAVAFGVYAGEMRALIGLFKFEGLRVAGRPLGRLLACAMAELAPSLDRTQETLVAAVPLFRGKARERGFNQAELLTAQALRALRRSHPEIRLRPAHGILARVKQTESQFGLNPRQRRENLRGAFAVPKPALVDGRDVLLVDDIYTTGATARACAAVLKRAGAARVFVATLSRAQTESVALWEMPAQSVDETLHNQVEAASPHRRA